MASIGDKLYIQTIESGESSVARQIISTTSKTLSMFTCQNGLIYISSALDVWCLKAVPFAKQIKRLLEDKDFQLALKLAVSNQLYLCSYYGQLESRLYSIM